MPSDPKPFGNLERAIHHRASQPLKSWGAFYAHHSHHRMGYQGRNQGHDSHISLSFFYPRFLDGGTIVLSSNKACSMIGQARSEAPQGGWLFGGPLVVIDDANQRTTLHHVSILHPNHYGGAHPPMV